VDYLFSENDCWARVLNGVARVGISDYMQQRLTDITYVDPPEIGTTIGQFDELGTVSRQRPFESYPGQRHRCGQRGR
jgi:glycine cleavage system H protein